MDNKLQAKKLNILLAAGGTGGHISPAEALAEILNKRGHRVFLATDIRGMRFAQNFPAHDIKIIEGATVFSKSPISLIKSIYKICKGVVQSLFYVSRNKVDIVVGFGGYPSFTPMLAGKILLRPSILHEQNAVLGRANRVLTKFSKQVALSFPETKFTSDIKSKTSFVGNPLRKIVIEYGQSEYQTYDKISKFKLVVFGGSQGAKIFSDILPNALGMLPKELSKNIKLTQQVANSQIEALKIKYQHLDMDATLAPFFDDMPKLLAESQLVIGRAGASTVTELCYLGRPALLVPLPGALDADQANNARNIVNVAGGFLCEQKKFTAKYLAEKLEIWMNEPQILADAAKNAKKLSQPNAADLLADMVEKYAK